MRACRAIALALGLCSAAAFAQPSPFTTGILSAIIPGWGQAIYGDYETAALHFGVFATSLSAGLYYQGKPDYLKDDVR